MFFAKIQKRGDLMKKLICICLLISMTLLFVSCGAKKVEYTSLGIPTDGKMMVGTPRTPWDMIFYDGMLYVGNGCYDDDAGPITVWRYDTSNGTWGENGIVPDEEVSRFLIIGGELVAPGIDPQGDWTLGNYYVLRDNVWETIRTIPGGLHNFDMVELDDVIFAGIGVASGEFPIVASYDGGASFEQLPMYRDGAVIDTTLSGSGQIRVYELFTLHNTVYALYAYRAQDRSGQAIYRYEDHGLHFVKELPENVKINPLSYEAVMSETVFKERMFFTTGYLYVTDNMEDFTRINLGDNAMVTDLQVIDEKLYCTTVEKLKDGQYKTSLWCNTYALDNGFNELFYFTFPSPAQCFDYYNGKFYFGMGDGRLSDYNDANGTILSVEPIA
jgi:hypothetical protein